MNKLNSIIPCFIFVVLICFPLKTILGSDITPPTKNQLNWNPPEICNNGIDDDLDGLIDCYDPDCCADTTCEDFYFNECPIDCEFEPTNRLFDMTIEWSTSAVWHSYNTGITGDVDGDGLPEVIGKKGPFVSSTTPYRDLLVINGQTGAVKAIIPTEHMAWTYESVALADINKNGRAEIIMIAGQNALNTNSRHIFCFEFDGTTYQQLWMSDVPTGYATATAGWSPSIADFNQDGIAEIYVHNEIYNGLTGQQILDFGITGNVGQTNSSKLESMVVAADVLPDSYCTTCQGLELVAGNQVYAVNIDPAFPVNNSIVIANQATIGGDGNTAIADIDRDGDLDAVITYNKSDTANVLIWDIQTPAILVPIYTFSAAANGWLGLPNIADVDNNGTLEIGVCAASSYRVLSYTPTGLIELWSVATSDVSGRTGSTVFDFEGDGDKEIAYRDQSTLRIIEGATGTVLYTTPCTSGTAWEYPVVVDVDKDGETELLCSCDNTLRAYKSAGVPWVPTRSVWNQHMYFNVNINDDMTIPTIQQQQQIVGDSLVLNNFLNQYSNPLFPSADATLSITNQICAGDSIEVSLTICNVGDNTLPSGMPITFYDGNPTTTATASKIYTISTNTQINIDSCSAITYTIPALYNTNIFAIVNDNGTIPPIFDLSTDFPSSSIAECDYSDNMSSFIVENIVCATTLIQDVTIFNGNDGSAAAAATNGVPPYSYIWSDGQTTPIATGLSAGTYSVTVSDNFGCASTCDVIIAEPHPDCTPCAIAEANNIDICIEINGDSNHPWASLDCDNGGITNGVECLNSGDPQDSADDCLVAIISNTDICALINNDPDHPLVNVDCDQGGIPNILECQNNGNPSNSGDECAVAMNGQLNVCKFINYESNHPMSLLDCDMGGVTNYSECINGSTAIDSSDDCTAAVRGALDICAMINNDPNHPWASLDCDLGGIINITECANGGNPSLPSDDLICSPNLCAEAIVGAIDICDLLTTDPNHPVGTLDCDGDGVTNASECTDGTDPLDPCDYEDTSITLPVTADQSDCPFPCPDLTPIMTILPGNIAGNSAVEVAVQVTELDSMDTNGSIIIVRIPSDPRFQFVWDIGLTQAALVPVQNANWNYLGDNGFVHTWTYSGPGLVIPAESVAAFGFQSIYDPQSTDGQTTLTATIVPFSGGECNILNNTDSERLVYFQ